MTMASRGAAQVRRFHLKCSNDVNLSEDGKTAWTNTAEHFGIAFTKEPIPRGRKFFVKVLEPAAFNSIWCPFLGIGFTTRGPGSGAVLQKLDGFTKSDQHWYVKIDSRDYTVQHKGQQGRLPWELGSSKGRTVACFVSENGEFHLCSGESDVDDVVGKGLPRDSPLWGFVALEGAWRVEASYEVAMPKGHPQSKTPAAPPQDSSTAGHTQDYAGKTFHFVERPPEGLICAVCQALAHDPVQANCCGNIYCVQCIKMWKTRSNSCPTCRSTEQSDPPFNVFKDRNAHQRITSLAVYCPHRKEGCNKTMELSEVANHLTSDSCFLFQRVECEYKWFGCAVVLLRKDIAEHLKTSVQAHLQMTKRRVEEQETQLKQQEAAHQLMKERIGEMNKAFGHMVAKVKQLERNQK